MNTEIIYVSFREKKKVNKYVVTTLICNVCKGLVKTDSRNAVNPQYIALDNWKKENACICKDCAVDIRRLCESSDWN